MTPPQETLEVRIEKYSKRGNELSARLSEAERKFKDISNAVKEEEKKGEELLKISQQKKEMCDKRSDELLSISIELNRKSENYLEVLNDQYIERQNISATINKIQEDHKNLIPALKVSKDKLDQYDKENKDFFTGYDASLASKNSKTKGLVTQYYENLISNKYDKNDNRIKERQKLFDNYDNLRFKDYELNQNLKNENKKLEEIEQYFKSNPLISDYIRCIEEDEKAIKEYSLALEDYKEHSKKLVGFYEAKNSFNEIKAEHEKNSKFLKEANEEKNLKEEWVTKALETNQETLTNLLKLQENPEYNIGHLDAEHFKKQIEEMQKQQQATADSLSTLTVADKIDKVNTLNQTSLSKLNELATWSEQRAQETNNSTFSKIKTIVANAADIVSHCLKSSFNKTEDDINKASSLKERFNYSLKAFGEGKDQKKESLEKISQAAKTWGAILQKHASLPKSNHNQQTSISIKINSKNHIGRE